MRMKFFLTGAGFSIRCISGILMNFSQQKEYVNRIAVVLMSCWKRCIFFSETTKMHGLLLWNVLVETRFCTLCHLPKSGHTWLGSMGLTCRQHSEGCLPMSAQRYDS